MNDQEQAPNPLMEYTRRPVTFLTLPSGGKFTVPVNPMLSEEIGVKPMNASDELSLKTPEALLNGTAISDVIRSCTGIEEPHELTINDIDALLVAIRLATYGEELELEITCPKCEHENTFSAPIQYCLENMKFLDDTYIVQLSKNVGELKIQCRPYTFDQSIKEALKHFKESKAMSYLLKDDIEFDTEQQEAYAGMIQRISDYSIELLSDSIMAILDSEGNKLYDMYAKDSDANHITNEQKVEWVKNLPTKDAFVLVEKVKEINGIGIEKTLDAKCQNEECGHEWTSEIDFDPANFFDKGL